MFKFLKGLFTSKFNEIPNECGPSKRRNVDTDAKNPFIIGNNHYGFPPVELVKEGCIKRR